jgi:hypothetical protein
MVHWMDWVCRVGPEKRVTGTKPSRKESWFVILRMYGPLKPWIEKTLRPSEIELVG